MAVVPQKNRRVRIILDLSFPVYPGQAQKGVDPIQSSVNETTERLAPDVAVQEIYNVFRRILHFIDLAGTEDVVMLAKIDLSDECW